MLDKTEILLKVALNTITQANKHKLDIYVFIKYTFIERFRMANKKSSIILLCIYRTDYLDNDVLYRDD